MYFDLFQFLVFLIGVIYIAIKFFRSRTKYNLAMFIILMIFLVISSLDLILPGDNVLTKLANSLGIERDIRIVLAVIISILFIAFLFYPELKRFLRRRKMKSK